MSALTYETLPLELRDRVPGFDAIYAEHVRDYDEVLPHVLLGDLVRYLEAEVRAQGPESAVLRPALSLLEAAMSAPDPRLQELIAVSFLENLDRFSASYSTITHEMGPRLREQLRAFERA